MNQIHRLVFNRARGVVQVTSELGHVQGKRQGGRRKVDAGQHGWLKESAGPVAVALALSMAAPLLWAAPVQGTTALSSATGASGGDATGSTPGAGTGSGSTANNGGSGGNVGKGAPGAAPAETVTAPVGAAI